MLHPAPSLLVIGAGNMGKAIIAGALAAPRAHAAPPPRILAAEPDPAKRQALAPLGVTLFPSAREAVERVLADESSAPASPPSPILLAVKPQSLPALAAEIAPLLQASSRTRLVISILAGVPRVVIAARLGPVRVIRAMPNLPASIALGITALAADASPAPDLAFARALFESVGRVVSIDESLMDAFTALAGSGPAYLFYLAEAMTRAAAHLGFDPAQADLITRQTLLGSATLLDRSPDAPAVLRAAVTSVGGTTAAATSVLDRAAVLDALVGAITAARDRGIELGRALQP